MQVHFLPPNYCEDPIFVLVNSILNNSKVMGHCEPVLSAKQSPPWRVRDCRTPLPKDIGTMCVPFAMTTVQCGTEQYMKI